MHYAGGSRTFALPRSWLWLTVVGGVVVAGLAMLLFVRQVRSRTLREPSLASGPYRQPTEVSPQLPHSPTLWRYTRLVATAAALPTALAFLARVIVAMGLNP